MKMLCEQCGEIFETSAIRVEGGAVVVTCALCGFQHRGASEEADSPEEDVPEEPPEEPGATELPPVKCPKCFHRQHATDYCTRCGLDFSLAEALGSAWEPDPEGREEDYARALALWSTVELTPGDETAHTAFFEHCRQTALVDLAARRYLERRADHPEERLTAEYRARAVDQMEKVALAMLSRDSWSADLKRRVRTAKGILIVLAVILLVAGLVFLILMWGQRQAIPGNTLSG